MLNVSNSINECRTEDENVIYDSGLFDRSWYLEKNADVSRVGFDPLQHYILHGFSEGRNPSPFFDSSYYLGRNPDVAASGMNPLLHYIKYGEKEGRSPSRYFDVQHYNYSNCDVASSGMGALQHFVKIGRFEGRKICSVVDPTPEGFAFGPEEPFQISWSENFQKIAVAIHLYYIDVFPEICEYIKNIPCHFTALFSIPDISYIVQVKSILKNYNIDCTCEFKVAQNRGRNFGPMLVDFRNEILESDIFLHIHTKKSLRTGGEQVGWRRELFSGLMGSEMHVRAVMDKFGRAPDLGVIYPASSNCDYWFYHWLGALHRGRELFSKIGIQKFQQRGLLDFPLGGMFWARTSALKSILHYPWSYSDFEAEPSYHDGTLPHAIERSIANIAKNSGFNYCEMDSSRGVFRTNWGMKKLENYDEYKYSLEYSINNKGTISFDFL